jgi:GT2 family glycosyltransferase
MNGFMGNFHKIKLIRQNNRGRAAVRNRGAQEAAGQLLIFYDDDMQPESDSVKQHLAFHAVHQMSILGGDQIDLSSHTKTDIQNYKAHNYRKWTRHFKDGLNLITNDNTFLTAANMSISKALFNQMKGFDERLTDIEDLEFAKRALKQNVPIYFDKSNKAIHHDFITCRSYIDRVRQYTLAQQHLHHLFPDQFPTRLVVMKHKKYFYRLFAFPFWPYLIDNTNWLRILPSGIRYKIYEWVIYSLSVAFADTPLRNKIR